MPLSFIPGYGRGPTAREEARWQARHTRHIEQIFSRGLACLKQGERQDGMFWLQRADRLAGGNDTISFACAMALLDSGDVPQAVIRLQPLWHRLGVREAGLALAGALLRCGRQDEARHVMGQVLSRNSISAAHYALADALSLPAGLPGWAALSNNGSVRLRIAGEGVLMLDGRVLASLPAGVHDLSSLIPAGAGPWSQGQRLGIHCAGQAVLGSPIDIQAVIRCASLVSAEADGVRGWMWYPGEAEFHPALWVEGAGPALRLEDMAAGFCSTALLQRPYGFYLPYEDWPRLERATTAFRDDYDRLLHGAPLAPALVSLMRAKPVAGRSRKGWTRQGCRMARRGAGSRRAGSVTAGRERGCAVIMPVYRGEMLVRAALEAVLKTIPRSCHLILVDDATPETSLRLYLEALARDGRARLVRHEENRGFVASINTGLALVPSGHDVILLNSDTLVSGAWVERLCRWLGMDGVGTVTPFSNAGGLTSYPAGGRDNPAPPPGEAAALDRLCQTMPMRPRINLPTANGFCMGISAACLAAVGSLRQAYFAQGYGEENDFCLRASEAGFCHLAAVDVYVLHQGHGSFGQEGAPLLQRNLTILNRLYPGYDAAIRRWKGRDPLRRVRRWMDWQRVAGHRRGDCVLLIQHLGGGGVARAVREQAGRLVAEGVMALRLEPTTTGCRVVSPVAGLEVPNLVFDLPEEQPLLLAFLREMGVRLVVWHHMMGHEPGLRTLHEQLGVPYEVHVHDHVWFCPRIALLDQTGRYCGEPDLPGCEACLARGDVAVDEGMPLPDYLARSRRELERARRIVAPSADAACRLARHMSGIGPVQVEPLEDDRQIQAVSPPRWRSSPADGPLRILVLGGISRWKGYDVLLALGRYIQQHHLPLHMLLVGSTHDDEALIRAGVAVTGAYRESETLALVKEGRADMGFVPSVAPETWCYALGWLWRAGLPVVGFDIGASAERIRQAGPAWGQLVPLGLPVERLAAFFMARGRFW